MGLPTEEGTVYSHSSCSVCKKWRPMAGMLSQCNNNNGYF